MSILISSLYSNVVLANELYANLNLDDAVVEDRLVFNVRISVISNIAHRESQRL